MQRSLSEYLLHFALTNAEMVANTGAAFVWKTKAQDGASVALKIYKRGHMGNETHGFAYLEGSDAQFAARVLGMTQEAAVIEWLDGPSLGDLARNGRDQEAARILGEVASGLHTDPPQGAADMPQLTDWLSCLHEGHLNAALPPQKNVLFTKCQSLAETLIRGMQEPRALHGDLHYENIRKSPRGWCAFDAKGVIGPRAYELANAFRHPTALPDLVRDRRRIRRVRDIWSSALDIPAKELMQWAVVKCALSIVWRSGEDLGKDTEFDLLSALMGIMDETE